MAGEMFGVPIGLRAYQDDQVKLGALANQTRQANSAAALADAQVANLTADNARLDKEQQLKIDAAKEEKALQTELARIAAGGEAGGGDTPKPSPLAGGSKFDTLLDRGAAQVAHLQSRGRVKEAADLLAKLSNGVKDLAQARQAVSAAKENEWDAATKRHDYTSRFLSGVTDQTSYDQARLALAGSGMFSAEDLAEMPARYSARFVKGAIAGSAAAKQKADLEREASRTAVQNKNDQDQIKARELAQNLAERTHTLAVEREARLAKQGDARVAATGSKPLAPPNSRELEMVRAELKRVGIKTGVAQDALISDIAEQVKTLVDSNPGISRDEATTRIMAEMRERGDLELTRIGSDKYTPKSGSLTVPLPTPKTAAELKKGYYYLDAEDGLVKLFDGKGFKVATKRQRTSAALEE